VIKKIFKVSFIFFILFFLGVSVSFSLAGNKESFSNYIDKFTLDPNPIPIGDLAVSRIKVKPNEKIVAIRFLEKDIPFYPFGPNEYWFLLGVGLKNKPGNHPLVIKIKKANNILITKIDIDIAYRSFPEQFLHLPKNMVDLRGSTLRRVLQDERVIERVVSRVHKNILWTPPFIWPVRGKIISKFGLKRILNGEPRSQHRGLDLQAPYGTPIRATNSGKIALVRNCYLSGLTVIIDHGGGLYSLYAHLSRVYVFPGQHVEKGQIIGRSGQSGRATGPHLHWGISYLGVRVDPKELMSILGES